MNKHWLPLQSIPPGGRSFRVNERPFWQAMLDEFALDIRLADSVDASVSVYPQAQGVLFRGRLKGRVAMPCTRCSGESLISLEQSFDCFEVFPFADAPLFGVGARREGKAAEETDEAVIRLSAQGGVEINPAALAWQEFSLALPLKPLCSPDCKGLCPSCGRDKNTESCACDRERGDQRLAVLRGLAVQK